MAIDRISHGGGLAQMPQGARQLGSRVKPIIRLGMGVRDPDRGFPKKTDHFTVRGDERVIAKFKSVYGEQPKAIKIMVPSSLSLALDISYRSFVGGGDSEGGRPLALGMTNFAPLGYVGGPDVLRVWRQDGSYVEVETEGLDERGKPLDEIAADLKIEVHATFTFTIPDVLGWGSFCQITSKGKKTADNLAFKLTEIYSAFGSKAPWAFDRDEPPLLVIKPDTALMRMEKDGEAKWAKTKIFVLDVVIPESFHAMRDRLLERTRELEGRGGAQAALYGGEREEIGAAPNVRDARADGLEPGGTDQGRGGVPQASSAAAAPPADPEPEDAVWEPVDVEPEPPTEELERAGATRIPSGVYKDKTLADVAKLGDDGAQWLLVQLQKLADGAPAKPAIALVVRYALPDTWATYEAWKSEQS
jgi:hypothetical protein